jgi:hypothetical protein
MFRLLVLLCLSMTLAQPAGATPDRMETCRAAGEAAQIAVELYGQIFETAEACVIEGAELLPCLLLREFIVEFDGERLTRALATLDAGIVALCIDP